MVMTPVAAIVLALGSLFSLGVVYVREILDASDTQFGLLIALFGIGAAIGLGALQLARGHDDITNIRHGVIVQGATIGVMSLANGIAFAFVGAIAFGAATAFVLASGMSVLQSMLEGHDRVLAFTAFHVVIRTGLSLSAIGAGVGRRPHRQRPSPRGRRARAGTTRVVVRGSPRARHRADAAYSCDDGGDRLPVSILTDSAASLPKDITTAAAISVVPMWLTIGETSMHDGDLSLEEVLARIDEGITTSAPTPGEFELALEEAGFDDGALILTIAGTMSSTVQSAHLAAQSLDPERVRCLRHRNGGRCRGSRGARRRGCSRTRDSRWRKSRRSRGESRHASTWSRRSRISTDWRRADACRTRLRGRDGGWDFSRCSSSATAARTRFAPPAAGPRRSTGSSRAGRVARPDGRPATRDGSHVAALHALSPDDAEGLLDRVQATTSVDGVVRRFVQSGDGRAHRTRDSSDWRGGGTTPSA